MAFGSFLRKLKNVVAPVIGTAVAGPLGGIVAGGLAGAFDEGNKFKNILKGAGTAAAGIGVSKGLSALKGAVTAGDTASKALSLAPGEGITEPASGMLAKKVGTDAASELAKKVGTDTASELAKGAANISAPSVPTSTAQVAARPAGGMIRTGGMQSTGLSRGSLARAGEAARGFTGAPITQPQRSTGISTSGMDMGGTNRLKDLISGLGTFAQENPEVAMGIAQGLGSAFSTSPQEQEIEYMKELAAARARMLAPLYAQYSREFMG